jgi:hypothetical protein
VPIFLGPGNLAERRKKRGYRRSLDFNGEIEREQRLVERALPSGARLQKKRIEELAIYDLLRGLGLLLEVLKALERIAKGNVDSTREEERDYQ